MRTKVTLLLVFLNVALFFFIFYVNPRIHDPAIAETAARILRTEVVNLQSIEIKVPGGATPSIRIERRNDAWVITDPVLWPANDFAVMRIVNELQFLKPESSFLVEDVIKNGQSLEEFGLASPRAELVLTRANPAGTGPALTTTLSLGETTKVGNRLYLLSPDRTRVHVVNRSLADAIAPPIDQLRADSLFTIPVFEARSLGLQTASSGPRVLLRREGARWSFEAPIVARAAKSAVEIAVSSLNALRVGSFLSGRAATNETTGLSTPSLRITLEGNNRRETLLLGDKAADDPANQAAIFYARLEDTGPARSAEGPVQVFTVSLPTLLVENLRRSQETLRDPRVLDLDPTTVTALTLAAPGVAEPLVLQRLDNSPAGAWQIVRRNAQEGPQTLPADKTLVDNLLARLSLLAVAPVVRTTDGKPSVTTGFVSDAPSGAELETLGFNRPERTITLTLAPVAGGAAQQIKLELAQNTDAGGAVHARVDGQRSIYHVAPDTLNTLPVAARVFRERVLRSLPEGARITGLTLAPAAGGDPVYTRQLADGETWAQALSGEPAPRAAALEALLTHLRTLKAKQFATDRFADTVLIGGEPRRWRYRLDATIALIGGTGTQAVTSTLFLSERTGGGTLLAGSPAPEIDAIFEVEQPLLDALWTLLYAPRDPGPPPTMAAPEASAPAPTPLAQAPTTEPAAPTPTPAP